jgi:LacI family transcriptional regulator
MPVTIREIATKLELSIAAVSRALDGYPDISEETRQRVIATAQEMGYAPNRAARQLRRRKADAVGYILPSNTPRFADPFFSEFIAGLGDETARHPFDLLISIAPPGQEAEKRIYQSWVQGRKVDGFILTHLRLRDWRVEYLAQQGVPFVVLDHVDDDRDHPYIRISRQGGIILLLSHLAEQGFRRIACIGGPADLKIQAEQFDGYCRGLGAIGIPFDSSLVTIGDLSSTGGHEAAKRLLLNPNPPDAIITINDETAFGVLRAAREADLQVGRDLAVAGFDGVKSSQYTEPPLTTLDIPVYDIACQLVRMLVAEISGQLLPERYVVVQPRLVERESTTMRLMNANVSDEQDQVHQKPVR